MKKLKSINRKGRKGLTQSSQSPDSYRDQYQYFAFACFAQSLARFAVKKTISTAPGGQKSEEIRQDSTFATTT